MTDVYCYQAALICADCARPICADLAHDEDSDYYPQGPYGNGGGESDSPEHCDMCGEFLMNPLTDEGYRFVKAAAMSGDAPLEWLDWYDIDMGDE